MLEKKLEQLKSGYLLTDSQKKRVWENVYMKTAPENKWYYKMFEIGLVPKFVAAFLVLALFVSMIPNFNNQSGNTLFVKYVFGEVFVVRAANYINVTDQVPLSVGDYIMVREAGQAKIVSSKGYELTLNSNSIVEVTPKLSILKTDQTSIPFDEYALNLHRGGILGSSNSFVKSPLPIIASDKVIYSGDKGAFSINLDQKNNVDIRSLSGVVTVHQGLSGENESIPTKLMAGYQAYSQKGKNQNTLIVKRDPDQSESLNKIDSGEKEKIIPSEEQITNFNQKMVFLDIKLNQAVVGWFSMKDKENAKVWLDISSRVAELGEEVGFESSEVVSSSTDVYSIISSIKVDSLLQYISSEYDMTNDSVKKLYANLGLVDSLLKVLSDSIVLGVAFDTTPFEGRFIELSLNIKTAVVLNSIKTAILDKNDKAVIENLVNTLLDDETARILDMQGETRVKTLETLVYILSLTPETNTINSVLKTKFPDYYQNFFVGK